jgi:hypothetical protein
MNRIYDPSRPLVFVHIPKTAGISVRAVVKGWFGDKMFRHYWNESEGRIDGFAGWSFLTEQVPATVYGHFNRTRGFGVDQSYPAADQFVTIMREPFEQRISNYHYLLQCGQPVLDRVYARTGTHSLESFLLTPALSQLHHFPVPVTWGNHAELVDNGFLALGTTEALPATLTRIAAALGKAFDPARLERLNVTKVPKVVPHGLRAAFREVHALEYAVYDRIRAAEHKSRGP